MDNGLIEKALGMFEKIHSESKEDDTKELIEGIRKLIPKKKEIEEKEPEKASEEKDKKGV